jgi:hypothetical protein
VIDVQTLTALAAIAAMFTSFASAVWVVATMKAEGRATKDALTELRSFVGDVNRRSIDNAGWVERIRGALKLNGSSL